jgi:quinol monooxygenase YgiN
MRIFTTALVGAAMMALASPAVSQHTAFYTATYIEVLPAAAGQTLGHLRTYRDAARRDQGAVRIEVVQRLDRPNQFVVLGVWNTQQNYEVHTATPHASTLNDKLDPLLAAPFDTRQHNALSIGPLKSATGGALVVVVTHVDVIPPQKDNAVAALKELGDHSRKYPGNIRFDVWQQTNRPNHFTVVETWSNRAAFDSHLSQAETKEFRLKLSIMTGALYDERLYRNID